MTGDEKAWVAISDVFAGINLESHIVRDISHCSVSELERMCFEDVGPACGGALFWAYVPWDGFDEALLVAKIHRNRHRRASSYFYRLWHRLQVAYGRHAYKHLWRALISARTRSIPFQKRDADFSS